MKTRLIWRILTHATLLGALLFVTLLVLDQFNPTMDFINSDVSKLFLLCFALCALLSSVHSALSQFRERNRKEQSNNRT